MWASLVKVWHLNATQVCGEIPSYHWFYGTKAPREFQSIRLTLERPHFLSQNIHLSTNDFISILPLFHQNLSSIRSKRMMKVTIGVELTIKMIALNIIPQNYLWSVSLIAYTWYVLFFIHHFMCYHVMLDIFRLLNCISSFGRAYFEWLMSKFAPNGLRFTGSGTFQNGRGSVDSMKFIQFWERI